MKIFEVAAMFIPEKKDKDHQKAHLIVPVTAIVAKDLATAQTLAARMIPEEYVSMLDEVQVAVRPF
jgi:hypothetical protein